ncbi:UDP-N-acetylglucosamine--N-acetylmuramyl-(pentapeptide) pyrophosphoryl-undecaprenol N-acetylglucosamine transferase [Spirochaeta dissipatitropha]
MRKRIVFTGGGTGGHVFPGLAVAESLKVDFDIIWLGSSKGIEFDIVQRWGYPFKNIPAGKLRRYFSFQNGLDLFKVFFAFFASLWFFMKYKPALLFSKGGFVSVPPVYAAKLLGIPVVTHDSDLDPGLATRLNSKIADRICLPYKESLAYFPRISDVRLRVTGNPIRSEIYTGNADELYKVLGIDRNMPLVFVQGGSQGAEEINLMLISILPELLQHCVIVHQTGAGGFQPGQDYLARHPEHADRYYPAAFLTDLYPHVLAAASLSISRAGANSLWELAASQTPGIILPLQVGTRGDQIRNARLFEDAGMVKILADEDRNGNGLLQSLVGILDNPEMIEGMRAACSTFEADSGTYKLTEICRELICK